MFMMVSHQQRHAFHIILVLCEGKSLLADELPPQSSVMRSFDEFVVPKNKLLNNGRVIGDVRRHNAHMMFRVDR